MCDALRGRCAAEEFLKDEPTPEQIDERTVEILRDSDLSDNYANAFLAVICAA